MLIQEDAKDKPISLIVKKKINSSQSFNDILISVYRNITVLSLKKKLHEEYFLPHPADQMLSLKNQELKDDFVLSNYFPSDGSLNIQPIYFSLKSYKIKDVDTFEIKCVYKSMGKTNPYELEISGSSRVDDLIRILSNSLNTNHFNLYTHSGILMNRKNIIVDYFDIPYDKQKNGKINLHDKPIEIRNELISIRNSEVNKYFNSMNLIEQQTYECITDERELHIPIEDFNNSYDKAKQDIFDCKHSWLWQKEKTMNSLHHCHRSVSFQYRNLKTYNPDLQSHILPGCHKKIHILL